ncbi:uncharacterized protein EI90DRAFT_3123237 [Cantharellus anzutake]|uniref:uncharacterized protein n=1 Tax=Cantharellus anzutake TaxID=1750568 RepID=UPI001908CA97|nr:uncharacterized protein EI90DRAFT_3123237 [Cantharellus anzutake]KAF8331660.1 hypothetical protein EI90DRAFT_3123237 [Cantharellus anzutake]
MANSSSDDSTPPSSAFPTIAQWLTTLESDADYNPDHLCFSQYASEINKQGYYRLDELSRACQNKGLHELGVQIPPGLSEKLCHAMRREVRKTSRKFLASRKL